MVEKMEEVQAWEVWEIAFSSGSCLTHHTCSEFQDEEGSERGCGSVVQTAF